MLLYLYDEKTKEYLGSIPACLDPMASKREGNEVYCILKNSTLTEPMECEEGKVPVYKNNHWELVNDYRGRIVYKKGTGAQLLIQELGDIPQGYTLEKPLTLQDLKIEKIKEVTDTFNTELQKLINIKGLDLRVSDRACFSVKLAEPNNFSYITVTVEDRILNKVLEREEAQYILNYLYLREVSLSVKKDKLIKEITKAKYKKEINSINLDFDVERVCNTYAKEPSEKLDEYIKSIVEEI